MSYLAPVTIIILAGKFIWLFGKNSLTASCASCAMRSACSVESVANFSRSVPEVSERISQNSLGEIGAAI